MPINPFGDRNHRMDGDQAGSGCLLKMMRYGKGLFVLCCGLENLFCFKIPGHPAVFMRGHQRIGTDP